MSRQYHRIQWQHGTCTMHYETLFATPTPRAQIGSTYQGASTEHRRRVDTSHHCNLGRPPNMAAHHSRTPLPSPGYRRHRRQLHRSMLAWARSPCTPECWSTNRSTGCFPRSPRCNKSASSSNSLSSSLAASMTTTGPLCEDYLSHSTRRVCSFQRCSYSCATCPSCAPSHAPPFPRSARQCLILAPC
jgi:hypothetical protein